MFGANTHGIAFALVFSSETCSAERPVVPITIAIFLLTFPPLRHLSEVDYCSGWQRSRLRRASRLACPWRSDAQEQAIADRTRPTFFLFHTHRRLIAPAGGAEPDDLTTWASGAR